MRVDEAIDGKLDMVRRFKVDIRALKARDETMWSMSVGGDLYRQQPTTQDQLKLLYYDERMLHHSEVFAWDQPIIQYVRQQEAAEKFPSDVPFSRAWMFTPNGLWWFGKYNPHLLLRSAVMDPTGGDVRRPGCALTFWPLPEDPESINLWGYSYEHPEPTPGPVPITNVILRAGQTLDQLHKEWVDGQADAVGQLFDRIGHSAEKLKAMGIEDADESPTKLAKLAVQHNLITRQDYLQAMRNIERLAYLKSARKLAMFFLAGSLWLQQKVVSIGPGVLSRSARRRAEKVEIETKTRVVTLRKTDYGPTQNPGTGTPLNYRIRVAEEKGGFWRTYHFEDGPRPIWIEPYWRGPKDAPVKIPSKVVYKVSR